MKTLIEAMRTQLKTVTGVKDRDIVVVEDDAMLPATIGFPAIGLKDGTVKRKLAASGLWEVTRTVNVIVYVQLAKPEAAIMGSRNKVGVLDLTDRIHAALAGNLLNLPGMETAECFSETQSQLFGDENEALQRKILTYTYVQNGDR